MCWLWLGARVGWWVEGGVGGRVYALGWGVEWDRGMWYVICFWGCGS